MARILKNQCTAKSKQTGQRCKRPASPGKTVCYYHGGAKGSGAQKKNISAVKHGFYSSVLTGQEKKEYDQLIRVAPVGLADEIALLRIKIKRYLRSENSDFNFDAWERDVRKEFTGQVESTDKKGRQIQKDVDVTDTTKKPCGPELLLKMLGELRKLLYTQHQMDLDVTDNDRTESGSLSVKIEYVDPVKLMED